MQKAYPKLSMIQTVLVDAGLVSRKNAELVREAGDHYILRLKSLRLGSRPHPTAAVARDRHRRLEQLGPSDQSLARPFGTWSARSQAEKVGAASGRATNGRRSPAQKGG